MEPLWPTRAFVTGPMSWSHCRPNKALQRTASSVTLAASHLARHFQPSLSLGVRPLLTFSAFHVQQSMKIRIPLILFISAAVVLFLIKFKQETPSFLEQRLRDWIPKSANSVYLKGSGGIDETILLTFRCPDPDFYNLRSGIAMEEHGTWKPLPLDRRTADILAHAKGSLKVDASQFPADHSTTLEYLEISETKPYLPVGSAIILEPTQKRIWYIHSEF